MVKRIDISISESINGEHADSKDCERAFLNWLAAEMGGIDFPPAYYKYRGVDIQNKEIIHKVKKKKQQERKKVILEKEFTVELGGAFEPIGYNEESIGGGNQKIGSGE